MDTIIPFPIINALYFQKEIAEILGKVMCMSRPSIVKKHKTKKTHSILSFQMSSQKALLKKFYFDPFCWGILLMGTYTLSPFILKRALRYYTTKKTHTVCNY